ncbi:MAG: ferrochelatase [Gemmatimonadota bacterium]
MNQLTLDPSTGPRSTQEGPTGIVLLNLGGPKNLDEVGPFLLGLFQDREIIQLPFQKWLGPFIAKRRTPKVQRLYEGIGGGSPILDWTNVQGQGMVDRLDRLSPETAPHTFYVAFRYIDPFSEDALKQMKADGVKRAIAFTQYQHFSCATTGSSLNELWRAAGRLRMANEFQWSVIDRWPTHPSFIRAMVKTVQDGLGQFREDEQDDVLLMFSAHSLPLSIIDRGDPYPQEVGASVHEVLKAGGFKNQFVLCYQSEVGPVPWLGPSTEHVIRELGAKGRKRILVVGIAFTSDHIETLSEIDIEYAHLARSVGITEFRRAPAFNGEPLFQDALAEIVLDHLRSGEACSSQYGLRCPGCTNPQCRDILNPAGHHIRTPLTVG